MTQPKTEKPCRIELPCGGFEYRYRDLLHRRDGPAKVRKVKPGGPTIMKKWCLYGELHREDGPALRSFYQGEVWLEEWYHHGKLHGENGPAVRCFNHQGNVGKEVWYRHGMRHKEDGPALTIYQNGNPTHEERWIYGERLPPPA